MTDFMVNRSYFFFLDLVFIDYCLNFWVVFTKMVAEKIETLVVFMEGKKKNGNHLVPRLCPFRPRGGFQVVFMKRFFGRRLAAAEAAGRAPGGFNLFYFCLP